MGRDIRRPSVPLPWGRLLAVAGQNRPTRANLSGVTASRQFQRVSLLKRLTSEKAITREIWHATVRPSEAERRVFAAP